MWALLRLLRSSASAPPPPPCKAAAPGRHKPHEDSQALPTGTWFVALGVVLFGHVGLLTGGTTGLAFLLHCATGWTFGALAPGFSAMSGGLLMGAGMVMLFRHRPSLGGFNVRVL